LQPVMRCSVMLSILTTLTFIKFAFSGTHRTVNICCVPHSCDRHEDLKQMLDSNKDNLKLEAMKRIIGVSTTAVIFIAVYENNCLSILFTWLYLYVLFHVNTKLSAEICATSLCIILASMSYA